MISVWLLCFLVYCARREKRKKEVIIIINNGLKRKVGRRHHWSLIQRVIMVPEYDSSTRIRSLLN